MRRLKKVLIGSINGISQAGIRFPMAVVSLLATATVIFRLIATNEPLSLVLQKLMFTFIVGSVLGVAAQFTVERLNWLSNKRILFYGVAGILLLGYFLILLPAPEISGEITVRSLVTVFALICLGLWIPSYRSTVNFNLTALIHFKSFFTSLLYSGVLSAGIAAIIAAIHILLFKVNNDTYAYAMTVIWVVFAPVYYLSLLPKLSSELEADEDMVLRAGLYPKFLDILISNIAIPLISAYTLVLIAYFLKILFTLTWPSGQVGPMVLVYSAAGLVIFILASLLENRWVLFYRKVFPKILIPIVIIQLISAGIRLNAYGLTESRYYIILFGIFSILAGLILSFSKVSKNERLALLAAAFAILSIIPPVDAFTVSRYSQIGRIESILKSEGILANGQIIAKEDASEHTKIETTSILQYLERSSSLKYISWLPEDFRVYQDMEEVFGFEPAYPSYQGERQYFYASLDTEQPLPVAGYDVLLNAFAGRYMDEKGPKDSTFELDGRTYQLKFDKISSDEVYVAILDQEGKELIGTGLHDFARGLIDERIMTKEVFSPEEMSFEVTKDDYRLRIIFQNVHYTSGSDEDSGIDYNLYILFAGTR